MPEEITRAEAARILGLCTRQLDRRRAMAGVTGQRKTLVGRLKICVFSREDMDKMKAAKRRPGKPTRKKEQ